MYQVHDNSSTFPICIDYTMNHVDLIETLTPVILTGKDTAVFLGRGDRCPPTPVTVVLIIIATIASTAR